MARTKAVVDDQRMSSPTSAARAPRTARNDSDASAYDSDDMDLDEHSPLAHGNTSDKDGNDNVEDEDLDFAADLVDDATPEQAQALLGERSKRQTLFASMFADIGAASSLSASSPSASPTPSTLKAPRGKRMRRPNLDDEDFNPDEHVPLRRSTRSRAASKYDDDDDDGYDSEFEGGSKKKKRKTGKPIANVHDLDRSELMRTYKTTSDVSHLKLPYARVPDPYPTAANRTFGPILGVPVGSLFYFRQDVHHAGIHRGFVAGIFGHEQFGCWSICVNGGYPEDIDEGDRIVFTGSGGRELATKNLRTADQSCDQSPNNKCNASLIKSHATGLPIRVVRGPKSHSPYTPVGAYRYDGLYRCTNWEFATGKTGFRVLRFTLERLEGQTPLADLPTGFEDERWVGIRDQVLAFRGMTVEQLEAQAQAAESQVGQVKESRGNANVSVAAAATTTTEARPKRAASAKGKGQMKVVDSEEECSASESDLDVEGVAGDTESAPISAPPVVAEAKAQGHKAVTSQPEPAQPTVGPTRRSTRSTNLASAPEPAPVSATAPTAAVPPRRSTRSTTVASSSTATTQLAATRSSARLNSAPVASMHFEDHSDTDRAQPMPSPPPRTTHPSLEILVPPPPRNAHLLHRKRWHLAQQAPVMPPSPLFAADEWVGMSRAQQAAVSARWRPATERVFVHPLEIADMGPEERRELELCEWVGGQWRAIGEEKGDDLELTPRASRMATADAEYVPRVVDSGVASSAEASPQRPGKGDDHVLRALPLVDSDSGMVHDEEHPLVEA